MIKWRSGLAGFAGNSKRLIKGVFSYVYTVTSAIIVPTAEGLEYSIPDNKLHFTTDENKLHFTIPENKLHYSEKD